MTLHIGFLVFPGVQQLDLTGPHDVLASLPGAAVHLVWKSRDTIASSSGLALAPTCTFDDCPPLDVICIPGGIGINALLLDAGTIAFVQQRAAAARYVTSVCTGALLLGVAGLLRGRRATTHWAFHTLLEPLGAVLTIAAELAGEEEAQAIQLQLEYAPAPPFDAGSPDTAPAAVVKRVTERSAAGFAKRKETIEQALRAVSR
jgi:cyclohexyl-isocyanide hydratase